MGWVSELVDIGNWIDRLGGTDFEHQGFLSRHAGLIWCLGFSCGEVWSCSAAAGDHSLRRFENVQRQSASSPTHLPIFPSIDSPPSGTTGHSNGSRVHTNGELVRPDARTKHGPNADERSAARRGILPSMRTAKSDNGIQLELPEPQDGTNDCEPVQSCPQALAKMDFIQLEKESSEQASTGCSGYGCNRFGL